MSRFVRVCLQSLKNGFSQIYQKTQNLALISNPFKKIDQEQDGYCQRPHNPLGRGGDEGQAHGADDGLLGPLPHPKSPCPVTRPLPVRHTPDMPFPPGRPSLSPGSWNRRNSSTCSMLSIDLPRPRSRRSSSSMLTASPGRSLGGEHSRMTGYPQYHFRWRDDIADGSTKALPFFQVTGISSVQLPPIRGSTSTGLHLVTWATASHSISPTFAAGCRVCPRGGLQPDAGHLLPALTYLLLSDALI